MARELALPRGRGLNGRVRAALIACALGIVFGIGAVSAQAATPGQLTQLASPLGCLTSDASLTSCVQLNFDAFDEPLDVAVSPDGLNAYAADYVNDSVDAFSRNPSTGALTQLSGTAACVGVDGAPCATGDGLYGARAVAVTADGQDVYVVSQGDSSGSDGALSEFSRNPISGALSEIGCISDVATIGGCTTSTTATGIGDPTGIAISPDGTTVYVLGQSDQAVAAFSRDLGTGDLTQLASPNNCISSEDTDCGTDNAAGLADAQRIAVSPDGATVYVGAGGGASAGDIASFSRDEQTGDLAQLGGGYGCLSTAGLGGCTADLTGLDGAAGVAVSPDGKSVYVASEQNGAVLEFARDIGSGDLTQLSPDDCVTSQATGCETVNAAGLSGAEDVAVSPDDVTVYVAGTGANAVAAFSRDPSTGDLTQLASPADCITSNASGCGTTGASAITNPSSLVVSPDNGSVYVASAGVSAALVALARAPVPQPTGTLTQLLEPNNCVGVVGGLATALGGPVPYGSVGCDTLLSAGSNALDVAVSPDGENAYEVLNDNELVEFSRDQTTGALSEIGCITQAASGCATGGVTITGAVGMAGPTAVAVSPDGDNVYVAGGSDNAVAEFTRAAGGLLTQLTGTGACIGSATSSGSCTSNAVGYGLDTPSGIVVSPDGKNVYVTGENDDAIAELSRDTSDQGALSPVAAPNACISDSTYSSDSSGNCVTTAVGLADEAALAISPDGANVYVAAGGFSFGGDGDIAEFSRNASTGVLSQLSADNDCVAGTGYGSACGTTDAVGVNGPADIVVSPDGKNVYASSQLASAVLEFSRDTTNSGALTQLSGANSCIGGDGCPTPANGLTIDPGLAISPDGYNVYATGADDNAIAVLDRDATTGGLTQPSFPTDCLSSLYNYPTGCGTVDSAGFAGGFRVTVSPDGANVYEAAESLPSLVELARQRPVDLALSEAGAPSGATVGGQITYSYTVLNDGPATADGPVLSVPLANELSLISVTPSQGSCSGTTTIICGLGVLANGASATVAITVALVGAGTATDTATVAYPSDPNTANNSVTTTTTIANPPSSPPPPPPAKASLAGPVIEQSTDAAPVSGSVLVELPNTTTFVPLSQAESIPMGSTINATNGTVQITVALPNGSTETGEFYDGEFVITQNSSGRVFETLTGGSFVGCPVAGKSSKPKGRKPKKAGLLLTVAKKSKTTVVRQLWGNAHGDFTTKGRYGSAAVSGTIWLTEDRCDGSYFKVTKDTIVVTANAHPTKHHNLKQGQSILIPAP